MYVCIYTYIKQWLVDFFNLLCIGTYDDATIKQN